MAKERAIDLQLIKPVQPGSPGNANAGNSVSAYIITLETVNP